MNIFKRISLSLFLILTIFFFSATFLIIKHEGYSLFWNKSADLPRKLFLSKKLNNLSRDMYVLINYPNDSKLAVKQIKGLPGDDLEVIEKNVFVNGVLITQGVKTGTSLKSSEAMVIPEGVVYAVAAQEDGNVDLLGTGLDFDKIDWLEKELYPLFFSSSSR